MKRKVIPFLLMIIALGLISSGCILGFWDEFKLDKNITLGIEKEIAASYNSITKKMNNLHTSMTEMNDFFGLYYKDVEDKKDYYEEKLDEIRKEIKSIDDSIEKTNEICSKKVDKNSKDKCNSLRENKEAIKNSLDKLEKTYNEFIENHEKWLLALAD